jgi:DNA-binding NarL/FixJ family response regulator
MKIKVTIADDHPVVLEGLQRILQDSPDVDLLDVCFNGEHLLQSLKKGTPDVLLLDIQMPGKRGDELAAYISQEYPGIAILALTNLDETFHVENMLMHGALGYLLKSSDRYVLLEAIKTVHGNRQYIDPNLKDQMLQDIMDARIKAAAVPKLTHRELEVLELIASEYTSPEIAEKLFISYRTVENHRLNLLFKLDVKNTAGLVRKALQMGLIK